MNEVTKKHLLQDIVVSKEFQRVAFIVSSILSFLVFLKYYDQFWYPPDDGAYAHVAGRILSGEVLNKDIHDIHMGYINIANAAALTLFGDNLASMRIPLLIMGIIQSAILFRYFQPHGVITSFVAAATMTVFSFVLFSNPTANWYGLFLTILLIAGLYWVPRDYKYRLAGIGFILGTLFLFRQLTGVIVAIGAVSFILFQAHEEKNTSKSILAKGLLFIMLLGLSGYLFSKISLSGIILFGIWPLSILAIGLLKVRVDDRDVLRTVGQLFIGGMIAFIPIVSYHFYHGSIVSWYQDTIVTALGLAAMPFISEADYFDYILYCVGNVLAFKSVASILNALFWLFILCAPMIVGSRIALCLMKDRVDLNHLNPLPFLGCFFALVAVHYQIPIYLFYTVGLTLCGYLWLSSEARTEKRNALSVLLCGVLFIAAFFQLGKPIVRPLTDILSGEGTGVKTAYLGGRVNLWLEEDYVKKYTHILEVVRHNSSDNESIFAFPSNSELYYVTNRKNPFRFFNSSFGIADQKQYEEVLSVFESNPPAIIFYSPEDKYNTGYSVRLADYIRERYKLLERYEEFEIYVKD